MFFRSVKEINSLWKETNVSLSKGMPNIHLKVTIEKKWRTQNLDFVNLKSSSPGQFWGAPTHAYVIEFSDLKLLKN